MEVAARELGEEKSYSGYGDEQGIFPLRKKIAEIIYKGEVSPEEIFISDGAKCDIGRWQTLFGTKVKIALQDPVYPVYLEGSILQGLGHAQTFLLPCHERNGFFPNLETLPPVDLLYICSPNNPTGVAYSFEQLEKLVSYAKKHHAFILFDAAYAPYIQDPTFPRSIYEIPGAKEVAIEIHSFSKMIGFTGVRLGWSVVPKKLLFEDGSLVREAWHRLMSTIFNGASIISQKGGLAALEKQGQEEMKKMVLTYMEQATFLRKACLFKKLLVYGGENAPYLWLHFPGRNSWELFSYFLEEKEIVVTPGSGFGTCGEGFLRLSAFAKREDLLKALDRI